MRKAVLISIKPEWCELILIGIAEDMGVNRSSLACVMYQKKTEKRAERRQYRHYTLEELRAAKERHDNGESWNAIAKSMERDGVYLKRVAEKIICTSGKEG